MVYISSSKAIVEMWRRPCISILAMNNVLLTLKLTKAYKTAYILSKILLPLTHMCTVTKNR